MWAGLDLRFGLMLRRPDTGVHSLIAILNFLPESYAKEYVEARKSTRCLI